MLPPAFPVKASPLRSLRLAGSILPLLDGDIAARLKGRLPARGRGFPLLRVPQATAALMMRLIKDGALGNP